MKILNQITEEPGAHVATGDAGRAPGQGEDLLGFPGLEGVGEINTA
jgi:hypothetical protein